MPKGRGARQPRSGRSGESPPAVGRKSTRQEGSRRTPGDIGMAGSGGWPPRCLTKKRVGVTRSAVALTSSSPVGKPIIHLMRILSLAFPGRGGPQPPRGQRQGPRVTPGPKGEGILSTPAFQQHPRALQAVRVSEARKSPMMVRGQKEGKQLV